MIAKINWRWAAFCSLCEQTLKLSQGDKIPKKCPNCGSKFDFSITKDLTHNEDDHTLEPGKVLKE